MAVCRDPEGWRAFSRIRDFDITFCFEEGVVISVLLGALLLSAVWRSSVLSSLPSRARSSKSWWLLRAKLVSFFLSPHSLLSSYFFRHFLHSHSPVASLVSSSFSTPGRLSLSFNPTSLNRYLLLLRSHSPISITLGPALPHRFFCFSGHCT